MPLKGWKTIVFNVVLAVVGALQAADWTNVLGSEKAGFVVTAIGIIGTILRFLTDTPALQDKPRQA